MYDVVALGELLVDFIQNGSSAKGNPIFEANPGGAPCNVLAMLSRLGYQTAFIGKVGEDYFGRMLGKTVRETGISDEGLLYDQNVNTTLALVHTLPDGDRDFSFYRKPGADIMLTDGEVNRKLIDECRVFHFGSLSLTDEPAATATKAAVTYAKNAGKLISFDPNLREPLWENEGQAKEAIWYGIGECDVLKIADNEIKWLTGKEDYDECVQMIKERSNVKLVNVTLGNEGSLAYYRDQKVYGRPFLSDRTIDTTGAGDTFCACVIGFLLENGLDGLAEADLERMLSFANAAASIITTRKGAIRSMPDREEVGVLLANYGKNQEEPKAARTFDILLGSVDKVKAFVNDMSKIEGDVLLCVGKYVIDAKSIMGIFSLELSKPLRLEIENWKEEYAAILEKYLDN
jgi:fructokinase